ncbi:MAG: hypothetical protein O7A06_04040 [Acidobacteria bacterium]|nr:hypothetical protein [Acidobacteriota bacterium]
MAMKAEQELRRELLFRVLDRYPNLDAAFQAVTQMERFILAGVEPTIAEEAAELGGPTPEKENPSAEARTKEGNGTNQRTRKDNGANGKTRKPHRWRQWAPEDDVLLRQYWANDAVVDEIAGKLERTPASIYGRARQLGLRRDKRTPRRVSRGQIVSARKGNGHERDSGNRSASKKSAPQNDNRQILNENGANEPVCIEEVVQFLRSRDYTVVGGEDGRYLLDGRQKMTAKQLFQRANKVRERLKKPCWPDFAPG